MQVVAIGPMSPTLSFTNGGPGPWSTGVWGALAVCPGGDRGAQVCSLWPCAEGAHFQLQALVRAAPCVLEGSQTAAKQTTQLSLGEQSSPFPNPEVEP